MINLGTILWALVALMALCGLIYHLLVTYFITPRAFKHYGEDDSRSIKWKAKVEKARRDKLIMIYSIGLAFSLIVLIWIVIQVKILNIHYR